MSLPILFSSHPPGQDFTSGPIRCGYSDVRLDPDAFPLAFEIGFAAFANGNSARPTPTFFVYLSAKDKIVNTRSGNGVLGISDRVCLTGRFLQVLSAAVLGMLAKTSRLPPGDLTAIDSYGQIASAGHELPQDRKTSPISFFEKCIERREAPCNSQPWMLRC
jgi:hypothetical protein